MGGSRGGDRGPDPPLKNHKNIGFLSNIGPDSLKNHKATKPAFNFGPLSARQRNAIYKALLNRKFHISQISHCEELAHTVITYCFFYEFQTEDKLKNLKEMMCLLICVAAVRG